MMSCVESSGTSIAGDSFLRTSILAAKPPFTDLQIYFAKDQQNEAFHICTSDEIKQLASTIRKQKHRTALRWSWQTSDSEERQGRRLNTRTSVERQDVRRTPERLERQNVGRTPERVRRRQ